MKNIKEVLSKLSDKEIIEFYDDIHLLDTIPDNSIIKRMIKEIYGKEDILMLQINQMIFPLLEIVIERFKKSIIKK